MICGLNEGATKMDYQEGCLNQSCPTCKTPFKCKTKLYYYTKQEQGQDFKALKEALDKLSDHEANSSSNDYNKSSKACESLERLEFIFNYGI
jgi:hypothetical protein